MGVYISKYTFILGILCQIPLNFKMMFEYRCAKRKGDRYQGTVRTSRSSPCAMFHCSRACLGVHLGQDSAVPSCTQTLGIKQTARKGKNWLASSRLQQEEQQQKEGRDIRLTNTDFTTSTACFRAEFLLVLKNKQTNSLFIVFVSLR